jgi:hypothetical protein
MRERENGHRRNRNPALRLVLAVLLALAPLLSTAGAPASMAAADGDPASTQMPCHSSPPDPAPGPAADPCPHCDAETPLTHCHCCDQAAPAGLAPMLASTHSDQRYTDCYAAIRPSLLPHVTVGRLYRPPIQTL